MAVGTGSMFVSIVVPCYARRAVDVDLLNETLQTVSLQTYRHFEVVVVDDGSPVEIGGVVARYPQARLIRRPNGGSAMARNTGIAASSGGCIVFLDADDHLLPHALEVGVGQLSDHERCRWTVGPREEMTYEGGPVPWTVAPPPRATDIYLSLLRFEWYIIPPSAAMFRRELVDEIGGFRNPWGADDLDFYLRAAAASPAWCYDSPAVTRYRRYSESSSRDGERMLRSVREVYRRQRPIVLGHPEREAAFHEGLEMLTRIFTDCLIENVEDRVRTRRWKAAARSAVVLARESPGRLVTALASLARREFPARGTRNAFG